jgi:hypothetical protein
LPTSALCISSSKPASSSSSYSLTSAILYCFAINTVSTNFTIPYHKAVNGFPKKEREEKKRKREYAGERFYSIDLLLFIRGL